MVRTMRNYPLQKDPPAEVSGKSSLTHPANPCAADPFTPGPLIRNMTLWRRYDQGRRLSRSEKSPDQTPGIGGWNSYKQSDTIFKSSRPINFPASKPSNSQT